MKNSEINRKRSIIRLEAITPLVIVLGLIAVYFVFFFDHHLRKGIEWAATQVNEAEVNVGGLKTSFVRGSLLVTDLQATDPKKVDQNWLELGRIEFKFSWDALLRGKFVVDVASVTDIQVDAPRARPGVLVPRKVDKEESSFQKKWLDEVSGKGMSQVGELLSGMDPTKNLKIDSAKLKSLMKIQTLTADLENKGKGWQDGLTALPKAADLAALQSKLGAIKASGSPAEVPGKVASVTEITKEVDAKNREIQEKSDTLTKEMGSFDGEVGKVDSLVKEDQEDLAKSLKLPAIDSKSLALQLFGPSVLSKLDQAKYWMTVARQKLSASAKNGKAPEPMRRGGRNFEFPVERSYPLFWLKRLDFASKGENGRRIFGDVNDLTSNPPLVFRPTVIKLGADLPAQGILGFKSYVVLDHVKEPFTETLRGIVGSFPVSKMNLTEGDGLSISFSKAIAAMQFDSKFSGNDVSIITDFRLNSFEPEIRASNKVLEEIISRAVKDSTPLTGKMTVAGTWESPTLSIESNLTDNVQKALETKLKAKLDEAKARINGMVREAVDVQRATLNKNFADKKAQIVNTVNERRAQVQGIQKMAEAKLSEVKSQASNIQQKAVDVLKNKLPF